METAEKIIEETAELSGRYYEKRDNNFYIGLLFIALCLSSYFFAIMSTNNEHGGGSIILNYTCTVLYLIFLIGSNYQRSSKFFKQTNRYQYICLMTLATISCLSLNLEINVFDSFSSWVNAYMMLMYGGLIAFCYMDKLPYQARIPIFFTLGMGTALSTYFTLYLLPLMPFGILLCFFFGLTLHLVVPLLVLINTITIFVRTEKSSAEKKAYALGLGAPLLVVLLFTMQWNRTNELINKTYAEHESANTYGLPAWVALSQKLSDGFFTQRILKGELLYTTLYENNWSFWDNIGSSFQDRKEHDPLIAVASFFSGKIDISREDRIQILKFYSKNRHDTERKLWSGKNLITNSIDHKTMLYPEYRLAYTEKTFTIKNNSSNSWRQEEALYTFSLPEGSVASSLSLWIEGVEQPSRLTTRGKADSAYVKIVGVERRDPALLHWQEGNKLTVTVFPCTAKEDRIFKIGITSPLQVEGEQLVLPPIYFEGPSATFATETSAIEFPTQKKLSYETDFSGHITCDKVPLSSSAFNFKNQSFQVSEHQAQQEDFEPSFIYLDVNKSWTKSEFKQVFTTFLGKPIFMVHNGDLQQVYDHNLSIFEAAQDNNFSLFPLEVIAQPSAALIISKSTAKSPNLSDLKETYFGQNTIRYLEEKEAPIALYNLSNTLSPYLQSLKEFYVFNYAQGSMTALTELAEQKQFPVLDSNPNKVVLHQANMTVLQTETNTSTTSKAPDHLMRLFSYNQILKKIGKGYFKSGYENQDLIDIASTAHIVSPISSMIVLETKKDYDRFDIEENEDGLGNASKQKQGLKNATNSSSGAVPEPHEWCFIFLISFGILFSQLKRIRS
jgi:XrtN system VIT domain protein